MYNHYEARLQSQAQFETCEPMFLGNLFRAVSDTQTYTLIRPPIGKNHLASLFFVRHTHTVGYQIAHPLFSRRQCCVYFCSEFFFFHISSIWMMQKAEKKNQRVCVCVEWLLTFFFCSEFAANIHLYLSVSVQLSTLRYILGCFYFWHFYSIFIRCLLAAIEACSTTDRMVRITWALQEPRLSLHPVENCLENSKIWIFLFSWTLLFAIIWLSVTSKQQFSYRSCICWTKKKRTNNLGIAHVHPI